MNQTNYEQLVLGSLCQHSELIGIARENGLQANDFVVVVNAKVYSLISQLTDEGVIIEPTILLSRGVPKQLVEVLFSLVVVYDNFNTYIESILSDSIRRGITTLASNAIDTAKSHTVTANVLLDNVQAQLLSLSNKVHKKYGNGKETHATDSVNDWVKEYERLEDRAEYNKETISWGYPQLDERLGRLEKGALYVVAGWTKHGKTWFSLDIMEQILKQNHKCLMLSGEMNETELNNRLVAMGGFDGNKVIEKLIPFKLLSQRVNEMRSWDYTIATGRLTLTRIKSIINKARLEKDPYRVIILDHLGQLMPDKEEGKHGRTEFLEYATAELKAMLEEHDITMILISQFTKVPIDKTKHAAYQRPPTSDDLRGSSSIAQIATTCIFVHREKDMNTGDETGRCFLLFPFHRSRRRPQMLNTVFTLPRKPNEPAYRFKPVSDYSDSMPNRETFDDKGDQALQQTFGATRVLPIGGIDDDIPF